MAASCKGLARPARDFSGRRSPPHVDTIRIGLARIARVYFRVDASPDRARILAHLRTEKPSPPHRASGSLGIRDACIWVGMRILIARNEDGREYMDAWLCRDHKEQINQAIGSEMQKS